MMVLKGRALAVQAKVESTVPMDQHHKPFINIINQIKNVFTLYNIITLLFAPRLGGAGEGGVDGADGRRDEDDVDHREEGRPQVLQQRALE